MVVVALRSSNLLPHPQSFVPNCKDPSCANDNDDDASDFDPLLLFIVKP